MSNISCSTLCRSTKRLTSRPQRMLQNGLPGNIRKSSSYLQVIFSLSPRQCKERDKAVSQRGKLDEEIEELERLGVQGSELVYSRPLQQFWMEVMHLQS